MEKRTNAWTNIECSMYIPRLDIKTNNVTALVTQIDHISVVHCVLSDDISIASHNVDIFKLYIYVYIVL